MITILLETPRLPYPITWVEQDSLFPKLLARLARMALFAVNTGLRAVRIHDLRHTFACHLRAVGVSMEDREVLLGHANHSMAGHYASADVGRCSSRRT